MSLRNLTYILAHSSPGPLLLYRRPLRLRESRAIALDVRLPQVGRLSSAALLTVLK